MNNDQRVFVVLPAYHEEKHIGDVVRRVLPHCPQVIVVDDGSADRTAEVAASAGAIVVRHEVNRGKGAAIRTGVAEAQRRGCDCVLTLDADGQHDPADIPVFVQEFRKSGVPVLIGNRMGDRENMPLVRRWTNLYMSWLLSRSMGQSVPDTQSGYRLYGAAVLSFLATESERFAAESEVLMDLSLRGFKIGAVPIRAIYGDEKSKIRPVRDTIRFYSMLWRFRQRKRLQSAG